MLPPNPSCTAEMVISEATEAGEKTLIPGMRSVSVQPLTPRKPQKPLDIGLFDEAARNPLSLF